MVVFEGMGALVAAVAMEAVGVEHQFEVLAREFDTLKSKIFDRVRSELFPVFRTKIQRSPKSTTE